MYMSSGIPSISFYSDKQIISCKKENNTKNKTITCQPALHTIAFSNRCDCVGFPQIPPQVTPDLYQHPVLEMLIQKEIFSMVPSHSKLQKTCTSLSIPGDFKDEFSQIERDTFYLRDPSFSLIGKKYKSQNRYTDALSTDEWLFRLNDPKVRLTFEGWKKQMMDWDKHTDCPYINATRVGSHSGDIITQGPLSKTEDNFWKMAWKAKASIVVMLTPLYEDAKGKSSHYFPEVQGESFSFGEYFKIKVRLIQELERNGFVNKELIMEHAGKERALSIIHCSDWQDKQTYPIDRLLWLVIYSAGFAKGNPLIAHCSAGIGRSGTFYACYLIYHCWKHRNGSLTVDVQGLVKFLRLYRPGLIHTAEQYAIIFDFIKALNAYPR